MRTLEIAKGPPGGAADLLDLLAIQPLRLETLCDHEGGGRHRDA